MPKITALIHVLNDEPHLGRALDSLRPCDEVVVVNHGASDDTVKAARDHGARVVKGVQGVARGVYVQDARNDWILCLLPLEAVAEELEASLLEWKGADPTQGQIGYNMRIREQNGAGWRLLSPELRLVNRKQINWIGELPPEAPDAPLLEGHILRIPDRS
jgi:glycosyltransferase involved in cell wall biosynthesis